MKKLFVALLLLAVISLSSCHKNVCPAVGQADKVEVKK